MCRIPVYRISDKSPNRLAISTTAFGHASPLVSTRLSCSCLFCPPPPHRNALHLACRNAHPSCVGILLAWGADESARANDGCTPWSELAHGAECRPPGCPRVAETARLLNNARGSRAWGRRGWLLMLKDKHDRRVARQMAGPERGSEMTVDGDGDGDDGDDEAGAGDSGAAPGATVPRGGGGVDDDMEAGEEGGDGEAAASGDLAALVGRLLAVGEEGCFRLVVGFL